MLTGSVSNCESKVGIPFYPGNEELVPGDTYSHLRVPHTCTSFTVLRSFPPYAGVFQCMSHGSSDKHSCILTQPLMCVSCHGASFLHHSFCILRAKAKGLVLCPWTPHGGLRVAKLHCIMILLPSSVFSIVTWTLKNFLGSNSHRDPVPCV